MENLSSNMQRYFVDIAQSIITFNEDDVFHISKVMRFKTGDEIQIVDKETHEVFLAVIDTINPLKVHIQERIIEHSELSKNVTLFFALAKLDKNELVIQKATELGVSRIVLFQGERSVVKYTNQDFARKSDRLNAIVKEASEQCHRNVIPEIIYVDNIKKIEPYLTDKNFFAYELEAGKATNIEEHIKSANKSVSAIIGPEGGFSAKEAEYLKAVGFIPISLGNRIYRCETAAIYALSVIAHILEK